MKLGKQSVHLQALSWGVRSHLSHGATELPCAYGKFTEEVRGR